jgi:hypothetical protein
VYCSSFVNHVLALVLHIDLRGKVRDDGTQSTHEGSTTCVDAGLPSAVRRSLDVYAEPLLVRACPQNGIWLPKLLGKVHTGTHLPKYLLAPIIT